GLSLVASSGSPSSCEGPDADGAPEAVGAAAGDGAAAARSTTPPGAAVAKCDSSTAPAPRPSPVPTAAAMTTTRMTDRSRSNLLSLPPGERVSQNSARPTRPDDHHDDRSDCASR